MNLLPPLSLQMLRFPLQRTSLHFSPVVYHSNVGRDNVTTSLATVALDWLTRARGGWRKIKRLAESGNPHHWRDFFPPPLPKHVTRTNTEYSRQPPSSSVDLFPEHSRYEGRAQARRHDPTTLTFRDNI